MTATDYTTRMVPLGYDHPACISGTISSPWNKVQLKPGDAVFLYTDGVTEAMNHKHREFTGERLLKSLSKTNQHNMADMINKVVKDVDKFASGAQQSDDITCLSFRYKGK